MWFVYCNVYFIHIYCQVRSLSHVSECHCHLLESLRNVIITKRKHQENIRHFVNEAASYQDVRWSSNQIIAQPLHSKFILFFSVSVSFCYVLSFSFFHPGEVLSPALHLSLLHMNPSDVTHCFTASPT